MHNTNEIERQYEECKVVGRSKWCPRKGFYRIISIYKDRCLNKPSLMATANWKSSNEDDYSDFVVIIQLESFLCSSDCIDTAFFLTRRMIGHEIDVEKAIYEVAAKRFKMSWEANYVSLTDEEVVALSNKALTIDEVNGLLMAGMIELDLDEDFGDDDDEIQDY